MSDSPDGGDPRALLTLLDISGSDHGHRAQYKAFLSALFPAQVRRFGTAAILARGPVLTLAIEESPVRHFAACLIRSLLGRRTAGFLMRPRPALEGTSLRLRAKRAMLRVLRRLPGVTTLTILPFTVEPAFARIARDWIYDPQVWDLHADPDQPFDHQPGALAEAIRAAAGGRPVCSAVGRQVAEKGFGLLATMWANDARLRETVLFAFGGEVDPGLATEAEAFAATGGFACDRMVSDAELLDLYAAADLVWCVYGREYDQASGILGRAMQFGIPVAVRPGSLAQRFCAIEGLASIAIDERAGADAFAALPARDDLQAVRSRALRQRMESIERLQSALGIRARSAEAQGER